MDDFRIRNRHRLQKKAIKKLSIDFAEMFDITFDFSKSTVDFGMVENFEVIIIDNELLGMIIDGISFLTVKGLLRFRPSKRFVTVDMGAVIYVTKGADVMAPGIVDADKDIRVDNLVWIRDQQNLQPLAIGKALMTGPEMVRSSKEKAVKSLHYVNDKLWNVKI